MQITFSLMERFNMTNLNVSAVQMHLSTVQFDPNSAESTTAVQFDDSIS